MAQATAADLTGCSPLATQLLAAGTTGATTYKWYSRRKGVGASFVLFDTRTDTAAFNYTFINLTQIPVEYEVKLEASNSQNCLDSRTFSVTVYPKITTTFSISPDTIGCTPLELTFTNTTASAAANLFEWSIDGGPALSTSAGTFTPAAFINTSPSVTRTYNITLSARNATFGCGQSITKTIYVKPRPKAALSLTANPTDFCSPVAVQFNGGATQGADSLYWNFGNDDRVHRAA